MVLLQLLRAGACSAQSSNALHPKHLSIYDAIGMGAHRRHRFLLGDPVMAPSDKTSQGTADQALKPADCHHKADDA